MSDYAEDDIQFEYESDGEQYGDDGEDEESILMENAFYEAQDIRHTNPRAALRLYQSVVEKEEAQSATSTWRFRALLNVVLIHAELREFDSAASAYARLLPLMRHVTRNETSDAINAVLEALSADLVEASPSSGFGRVDREGRTETGGRDGERNARGGDSPGARGDCGGGAASLHTRTMATLETIFKLTLDALQEHRVKRLWFRTCSRIIRLYIHQGEYTKATTLLADVRREARLPPLDVSDLASLSASKGSLFPSSPSCSVSPSSSSFASAGAADGEEMPSGQILEFYALESAICMHQKNFQRLRRLATEASKFLSAGIADPKNVAVVREITGKIHMAEKRWTLSLIDFSEAFRQYQEVGRAKKAKRMLQLLVLASLLTLSDINPFDTREAKALQEDPSVASMHALREAFEADDVGRVLELLTEPQYGLATDAYISLFVEDLLGNIRVHALPSILARHTCVSLQTLREELHAQTAKEVRSTIARALAEGRISGEIDEVRQMLVVRKRESRGCTDASPFNDACSKTASQTSDQRGLSEAGREGSDQKAKRQEEKAVHEWIDSLSALTRQLNQLPYR
ncbi:YALI0F16874p, related [Neospora caninum Liverpool]|uniref:YALI0F16874p, related n=1 Tax=Neospora caninum (strain Liverpool) TaxID=572307 RepID=F0VKL9_NEOCL|nr:YALI0F16874p, related [Neospora caninum Liverpool]CBZ54620.1 YALI0F16874p, related [Neospora caninum Liverpool]CEL69336.1 TPA: YALI0F16874p, related [Neospora caninum Liverpool]|eukprot:XP_003884650.1 YALI0F16874p, related [Neospora caninum Liverpool]